MLCSKPDRGGLPRLAHLLGVVIATLLPTFPIASAWADVTPHGGMLRYPAVSQNHVVFVYAGDLWIVGREGGVAAPLSSPPGSEARPRFSPDGAQIAFMGSYERGNDIYVIGVGGGVARRVTHHPTTEMLCQWTADGGLLYHASTGMPRGNPQLHLVSPEGGMPERLPLVYGSMGSISEDGRWLAFTPHTRDHRTWKRYRGGMATDIWLYDLRDGSSEKITEWEGTDTEPMWAERTLYYLSDAGPEHRWNVWAYDVDSRERRQVTSFVDYDVKHPSMGPGPDGGGEIIFEVGSGIHLLDVPSGEVRRLEVTIPGDRPDVRAHQVEVSEFIFDWDISATGKRALLEMRGDVWSLPAENGVAVNLTRSSGAAERNPVWSPDGRWIAWFSDASGEYEIYVQQSDGKGEARQLGAFGAPFKTSLSWSPKSDRILYGDKTGMVYLVDVESAQRKPVVQEHWGNEPQTAWSHDGRWIAYTQGTPGLQQRIYLYDVEADQHHAVTSGMFSDSRPVFDRKGDFFYYVSQRDFGSPTYEDVGSTFVYDDTEVLLMVPLRDDVKLPVVPEEDVETWGDEKKDEKKNGKKEDEKDGDDAAKDEEAEAEPVRVVLEGFEARALPVGVKSGDFGRVAVNDAGALVYVRRDDEGVVHHYDPSADEPEEKVVLSGFDDFRISADGKKIMVRKGESFAIVDAKPDQTFEDPISTKELETLVEPREEWRQMYVDAWRMLRDFFYDPGMHGVDWEAVRDQYEPMLEDCASRYDLAHVIREMISELNVGHAYYRGGDLEETPEDNVGMLGVDFELQDGAYRIVKIHAGAPWDSDARSPLQTASGKVDEGDYLLAVNGVAIDPNVDPWAAFVGTAGKVTRITVSSEPRLGDDAREVLVEPLRSDFDLRYRGWIEEMRQYVAERTDGKVGYVYVPNTGVQGQNDLFRQFYGQRATDALIIDERWNGGGQIPTRFVELLDRPITNYWATRDGVQKRFPWPYDAHQGPKCMLINGLAGSGGDAFPAYFRQAGLGKLVGERTWGGLVGISFGPRLVDGAGVTAPSFAFFEKDGTWGIEGHGVDPDIEVIADPSLLARGTDPQLDAAIELMLEEIERNPHRAPDIPPYPDRSGMGISKEDM